MVLKCDIFLKITYKNKFKLIVININLCYFSTNTDMYIYYTTINVDNFYIYNTF